MTEPLRPMTRKDLDALAARGCAVPGCDHGAHGGLILAPACHPGAAVLIVYEGGTLKVGCAVCRQPVIDVRAAAGTEEQVRDDVLDLFDAHERTCTTSGVPGTPCWKSRVEFLGYLCHCLGTRGVRLARGVAAAVAGYDARCTDPRCRHERN